MSKTRTRRSIQLTVVVANSLIDWLSKQEDLQLSRFVKIRSVVSLTKIRSVVSWFFRKIWVERQMKYIHRFQRRDLFIFANSRANWFRIRRFAIESFRWHKDVVCKFCHSIHENVMLRDLFQKNFRFVKIFLVISLMKTSCFMISL